MTWAIRLAVMGLYFCPLCLRVLDSPTCPDCKAPAAGVDLEP